MNYRSIIQSVNLCYSPTIISTIVDWKFKFLSKNMKWLSNLQMDDILYFIAYRIVENNIWYTEYDVDSIYYKLLEYWLATSIEDALDYMITNS